MNWKSSRICLRACGVENPEYMDLLVATVELWTLEAMRVKTQACLILCNDFLSKEGQGRMHPLTRNSSSPILLDVALIHIRKSCFF